MKINFISRKALKEKIEMLEDKLSKEETEKESLVAKVTGLNKSLNRTRVLVETCNSENNYLLDQNIILMKKLEKSDTLCKDLTVKIKKLNSSKGGLVKKKNLLEKKIAELNTELLKFKNGTYKLIKLPQGRVPKPQPIKIRSSSRLSAIAKQLHKDQEDDK